jgi:hypothetical protein
VPGQELGIGLKLITGEKTSNDRPGSSQAPISGKLASRVVVPEKSVLIPEMGTPPFSNGVSCTISYLRKSALEPRTLWKTGSTLTEY